MSTRGCEAAGGDSGSPAAGQVLGSRRHNAGKPLRILPNGRRSLVSVSIVSNNNRKKIRQLNLTTTSDNNHKIIHHFHNGTI
jgi:hypothetical protein